MSNDDTKSPAVSGAQDFPVAPSDVRKQLKHLMDQEGMSQEQAWEHIKTNIQIFCDTGKIVSDWTAPAKPTRAGETPDFFTETSHKPDILVHTDPNDPDSTRITKTAGTSTSSIERDGFTLSDEVLPPELRGRVGVLAAISQGLIKIDGEHPDAEILRASVAESMGDPSDENKPALRAIRERQLSFPFKHRANTRIIPSDFNQTSLFHVASNNSKRRQYKDDLMGTIGDSVQIFFTGEELRHDDEANFLQLLELARGKAPYEWIYAKNVPFIREAHGTKRVLSSKDAEGIDASLMRMRSAVMLIKNTKRRSWITVNLIRELQGVGASRRMMIDPCIVALLDSYSSMDQDVLYKLKGVCKQLFKYLSTKPYISGLYPTKVLSLFELCYGTLESITAHYRQLHPNKTDEEVKVAMGKKVSDFRRKALPAALEELRTEGHIITFDIDEKEDKVVIVKPSELPPSKDDNT